jgi:hypothetical protein
MMARSSAVRALCSFALRSLVAGGLVFAMGGCAPSAPAGDAATPGSDAAAPSDAAPREASTGDGPMCVPVGGDCTTNAQCCSGDCHEDHCD